MNILLDECLPRRLKRELPDHHVSTVPEMGWAGVKDTALLRLAEPVFEVFITADQNLQYQQNLHGSQLAILVLVAPNNQLGTLRPLMSKVAAVVPTIRPGTIVEISADAA